jgi:hypothetical protein
MGRYQEGYNQGKNDGYSFGKAEKESHPAVGLAFYAAIVVAVAPMLLAKVAAVVLAVVAVLVGLVYPLTVIFATSLFAVAAVTSAAIGSILAPLLVVGGSCCRESLSTGLSFLPAEPVCLAIGVAFALIGAPFFFVLESRLAETKAYWWTRHVWRVLSVGSILCAALLPLYQENNITALALVCAAITIYPSIFFALTKLSDALERWERRRFVRIRILLERGQSG